ncbi:MAG: tetratricopeptide repeat protein, partial [Vicinamibacterales bacterium]
MFFARAVFVLMVTATPALASQTAAVQPPEPKGDALYEFMMGRRLEAAGDAPGALAALQRAKTLDPQSGEISAEIAGHYFRTNRAAEAVTAAKQALELDK